MKKASRVTRPRATAAARTVLFVKRLERLDKRAAGFVEAESADSNFMDNSGPESDMLNVGKRCRRIRQLRESE